MATFVLVHGAWHWGGCWNKVREQLETAGHEVMTPTLFGMGETALLLKQHTRPQIGVMTHIQQITEIVRQSTDPTGIVLVAHSYAGIVASGVIHMLANQDEHNRIAHLVFLDAMVPTPQQATIMKLFKVKSNPPTWLQPWIKQNLSLRKLLLSTPIPPPPLRMLGFEDETSIQAQWVADHMTPFPVLFRESLKKLVPPTDVPITYLHCQSDADTINFFTPSVQSFAYHHGWTIDTLPCGHDAMVLLPTQLSTRLLQIPLKQSIAKSNPKNEVIERSWQVL